VIKTKTAKQTDLSKFIVAHLFRRFNHDSSTNLCMTIVPADVRSRYVRGGVGGGLGVKNSPCKAGDFTDVILRHYECWAFTAAIVERWKVGIV
jgi:hypothetical protein